MKCLLCPQIKLHKKGSNSLNADLPMGILHKELGGQLKPADVYQSKSEWKDLTSSWEKLTWSYSRCKFVLRICNEYKVSLLHSNTTYQRVRSYFTDPCKNNSHDLEIWNDIGFRLLNHLPRFDFLFYFLNACMDGSSTNHCHRSR